MRVSTPCIEHLFQLPANMQAALGTETILNIIPFRFTVDMFQIYPFQLYPFLSQF